MKLFSLLRKKKLLQSTYRNNLQSLEA